MKKIIAGILITTFVLSSPLSVFAATEVVEPPLPTGAGNEGDSTTLTTTEINAQAADLSKTNTSGQAETGGKAKSEFNSNAALEGIGSCVGSAVSGMISTSVAEGLNKTASIFSSVPTKDLALNAKEVAIANTGVTLDQIGFCVANALIHYISQATINWIKTGFEGSPAFVDDPGAFFKDIADREAGSFIQEIGGGFLCSSFGPKVQIALLNSATSNYSKNSKCSLSQVVENVESFGNNFSDGGWAGWISMTQVPQNNAVGAYSQAQQELGARVTLGSGSRKQELDWGKGYLSFKKCEKQTVTDPKTQVTTTKDVNCKTRTPGQIIETQVNQSMGLGKNRLVLADEFDEVVTALVNELIKVALSEALE